MAAGQPAGATGWVRTVCPSCGGKRGSFGYQPATSYYHCFRCGAWGWAQEDHADWAPSAQELATLSGPQPLPLPPELVPVGLEPHLSSAGLQWARDFLEARGVPRAAWTDLMIGACTRGNCRNRVVIPIEHRGKVCGWAARTARGNSRLKYLYPEGMDREELMFRGHLLEEVTDDPVFIVEGVFDALPHWDLPIVACLGKPTKKHIDRISGTRRPVIVALDGDAREEAIALFRKLQMRGKTATMLHQSRREDPGALPTERLVAAAQALLAG